MRDCSSASRAVVSAGSSACARSCSQWNIAAASAAPATAGGLQAGAPSGSPAANHASSAPNAPLAAPSAIATAHWPASGSAPNGRRPAHAASSQSSTDGNATLDPAAITVTHAAIDPAMNIAPIASTPCTKSSARSTTPTWHTSKTEPGAAAAGAGASASNSVVPKPVEGGSSPGRVVADFGARWGVSGVGKRAGIAGLAGGPR